jgi:RNA polymerase sigma factor (sigma-70 family)
MSESERSVAAVYRRYHRSLYRFCFSIVGNAEDAQDALQNAMVKAMQALPGEERQIQLKPWLYRIAHNESIEILRKRRDEALIEPELVASAAGPEETAAVRERLRSLLADLAELPDRQRTALVMRELAGLDFAEIGETLDTSPAAVRQTIYEARLSLRQLEAGREMSCASVMRQISDEDRRTMRRRDIKAHLRSCPECRDFRDSIEERSRDLAAIAPLPLAASTGILHALLSSAGGHASAGAGAGAASTASTVGVGAGKTVATSMALKSAATVAVVAAIGAGAADRGGLIDVGLPGGRSHETTVSESTPSGGGAGADAAKSMNSSTTQAGAAGDAGGSSAPKQSVKAASSVESKSKAGRQGASSIEQASSGQPTPEGNGQGTSGALPPASQHGQETAAAHKAKPDGQHSPGSHHEGSTHSHGATAHSDGHSAAAHAHAAPHTHSHSGAHHSQKTSAGTGKSHSHPPQHPKPPTAEQRSSHPAPSGAGSHLGRSEVEELP